MGTVEMAQWVKSASCPLGGWDSRSQHHNLYPTGAMEQVSVYIQQTQIKEKERTLVST